MLEVEGFGFRTGVQDFGFSGFRGLGLGFRILGFRASGVGV